MAAIKFLNTIARGVFSSTVGGGGALYAGCAGFSERGRTHQDKGYGGYRGR